LNRVRHLIEWFLKEQTFPTLLLALPQIPILLFLYRIKKPRKKEKKIICFTSYYYNGNAMEVYDKFRKDSKYDCYWIARNCSSIKNAKGKCIYAWTPLLHINILLNVDILVTSDSPLDFLFKSKPKTIQVKHGSGPKGTIVTKEEFDKFIAWCVSSDFIKKRHIELWNAPEKKLYVTGYPRMDRLLSYLEELKNKKEKKTILYAPTYDCGLWAWGDPYFEFEKFCAYCKSKDVSLILRLHPFTKVNQRRLNWIVNKYESQWLDMKTEPDTMKLLALADILVTDWSSIYTDYFLTERPIVYLETDLDYFTKIRGKSEVPHEFRAGEITHSSEEFYNALDYVLTKGNRYIKEQKKFLELIHGKIDGKATERVIEVIKKFL
jgi:CDP-glycerol glycerophosphotransferase (TagB/SpsB family)